MVDGEEEQAPYDAYMMAIKTKKEKILPLLLTKKIK